MLMKLLIKNILLCLLLVTLLTQCRKSDKVNADLSGFNIDKFEKGPLDLWLEREYLNPYNMEVLYRWDRSMFPLAKEITPPFESQIIPTLETVRDIWLKPYEDVAGAAFIKKYAPKQVVLAGSAQYNTDGTVTLGTADGGRRIVLYVINYFDKSNAPAVKRMMRTIHHEFAHIVNQIASIPPEFNKVSPEFTANWTQSSAAEAKSLGFVSQYARKEPGEDFAEMVAHLLVEGQAWFNSYVNSAAPESARTRLRTKEQIVVDYFKLSLNIDFRALQVRVASALDAVNPTVFSEELRAGRFTAIVGDKSHSMQSAPFVAAWNSAEANMKAMAGWGNTNLRPEFRIVFTNTANPVQVQLQIIPFENNSNYTCYFDYNMVVDADGTTTFTRVANRGTGTAYNNAALVNTAFAPLLNYLQGSTFKADWINNLIPGTKGSPPIISLEVSSKQS